VIVSLLFACPLFASAHTHATQPNHRVYPPVLVGPSKVLYPDTPERKGFIVKIDSTPNAKCEMPDDGLTLQIRSQDWTPQLLAKKDILLNLRENLT
jgi:hypothetical protein